MSAPLEELALGIDAIPLGAPLTGIGRYVYHLVEELQGLLPRAPHLFYGRDWSTELREPPAEVDDSLPMRVRRSIPLGFHIARALQQRSFDAGVRRHRIGLYHEPNFLAFRFAGPSVVTVHDLSWVRHPETHPPERVRVMDRMMPRVLRESAHVIADSEFTRGEILAHYGVDPAKVATVHLGVDASLRPLDAAACAPVLAPLGLEFGRYLLCVGTLEPRKNLATVVEAFAQLPDAMRRRFPLVVVGMSGWGEDRIAPRLRALVAAGEARMTGFLPQAVMPRVYSGARAFAYPSLYEGFGLPPLEAMACGVPAIVSDRASLPEIVGEAGLRVPALDATALARAIAGIAEDDALHARLAAAGIERARSFTWRACAEQTLVIYRKAAGR